MFSRPLAGFPESLREPRLHTTGHTTCRAGGKGFYSRASVTTPGERCLPLLMHGYGASHVWWSSRDESYPLSWVELYIHTYIILEAYR